jgi:hypothetical protein
VREEIGAGVVGERLAIINQRRFWGRRIMKGREEEEFSSEVAKSTKGINNEREK